jgi:hypothetical protein
VRSSRRATPSVRDLLREQSHAFREAGDSPRVSLRILRAGHAVHRECCCQLPLTDLCPEWRPYRQRSRWRFIKSVITVPYPCVFGPAEPVLAFRAVLGWLQPSSNQFGNPTLLRRAVICGSSRTNANSGNSSSRPTRSGLRIAMRVKRALFVAQARVNHSLIERVRCKLRN